MDVLVIEGGHKLEGTITVSSAKNASLPLMCAALLTKEPVVLKNVPHLTDVKTLLKLMEGMGLTYEWCQNNSTLLLSAKRIKKFTAPYELVSQMRASILVLGPLLARFGQAIVSLPGGCAIGARPVDVLLDGLKALGAKIELIDGYIHATAHRGLKGCDMTLPKPAVTGTENLMMAAVFAEGTTTIRNAAKEPEIVDLATMLNNMGAEISGAGTDTITIEGRSKLFGVTYTPLSDRIEAGTFILTAAMAGTGEGVTVENVVPEHNQALIDILQNLGVELEVGEDSVHVPAPKKLTKGAFVTTEPFPGFPTDLQAQMMAFLTQTTGQSTIKETIYEQRFMHVPELVRMGAKLHIEGQECKITGGTDLIGAPVMATDLRASASLVMAGLVAEGRTILRRVYHLDRGYYKLEEKLNAIGANITRKSEKQVAAEFAAKLKLVHEAK